MLAAVLAVGFVALAAAQEPYPDEVSLYGLSFSPFGLGSDQTCAPWTEVDNDNFCLSPAKVRKDLDIIRRYTKRIRTYSLYCEEGSIAALAFARETGMKVTLGVWVQNNEAANEIEFEKFGRIMAEYGDIVSHVVVGNEPVFILKVPEATLAGYIKKVRAIGDKLPDDKQPCGGYGTADIWNAWMDVCVVDVSVRASFDMDGVVAASDFIGLNGHPFWGGSPADIAPNSAAGGAAAISAKYGGKEVIITETGYPTDGPSHKPTSVPECPNGVTTTAVPGAKALETYLAGMEAISRDRELKVFHFEPFDSQWKQRWESSNNAGATDEHWGIFNCDRSSKGIVMPPVGAI